VIANNVIVVTVQCHVVLLNISEKLVCTENFGNLNKLVVVIFALEEGLLLEDHTSKHTAERPDVKRIVVNL
jgi:hypothetical protein